VMPGPDGKPHGLRVLVPTVNDLHRQAARITYTELRGPGVAVVHVPGVPVEGVDDMNTYDSMGNLETMPPTPGHPHGAIVVGNEPSREFLTFFRSQGELFEAGLLTLDDHVLHLPDFAVFVGADNDQRFLRGQSIGRVGDDEGSRTEMVLDAQNKAAE